MEGAGSGEGSVCACKTSEIDRQMIERAPSILKRCLLPQKIAGTAGNCPHWRGTKNRRSHHSNDPDL